MDVLCLAGRLVGRYCSLRLGPWWLLFAVAIVGLSGAQALFAGIAQADAPPLDRGIWISREEILSLPTEGEAWEALLANAGKSLSPNLSDQNDSSNVRVLARALVAVRTGSERARTEVLQALRRVQGTESGADALAIGRELMTYVIAAELIGLEGTEQQRFKAWLKSMQGRDFKGRTLRSTHEDRPNNWGTHAGASRLAVAVYLGDREEIDRAAHVLRGYLGEASGWRGFKFGELWWQPEQRSRNYGVNPAGALIGSHPVGGVIPDDQRRGGSFQWPPPRENYVYEALQGAVAQAVMFERLGLPAWDWGERAILRAFEWLHESADYPAQGDDTWIPHIVNKAYGAKFPATVPTRPGKAVGFADWTHSRAMP